MAFANRFKAWSFHVTRILSKLSMTIYVWFLIPTIVLAQHTVRRDPQALTILNQALAAGGGEELLASIRDFTENGTIAYNDEEQVVGNVTVKSCSPHQFRVDAEITDGVRTTLVNGEGGTLLEANGQNTPIPRQSAADLEILTLPYAPLLAALHDFSTRVIYVGAITRDGVPTYDIRIVKTHITRDDPFGRFAEREARDFYIDQRTSLVIAMSDRLQYTRPLDERLPHGITHEIRYSNYQSESGLMAPTLIVETFNDETSITLTVHQVTVNSGLSETDFAW